MRALLVEFGASSFVHVAAALQKVGIRFERAEAAEDTPSLARHFEFDIIIIIMSVAEDIGLIRRIRAARIDTPILAISDRCDESVTAQALDTGADDFVCKPASATALIARCKAIVRRSRGLSKSALEVGPLSINMDTHEVTVRGAPIHLPNKEYHLLKLLAIRKGIPVTKERILDYIYGGMDEPEAKIIDVFIHRLRKRLHEAGAVGLITTVWGRGYMLRENSAPAALEVIGTNEVTQLIGSGYPAIQSEPGRAASYG
ncbi:MAG: response regulator transcription factor [Acetobacteraceae bacterium]|nr:response regulator transcription factor [Acetobacteraceae bacterium]